MHEEEISSCIFHVFKLVVLLKHLLRRNGGTVRRKGSIDNSTCDCLKRKHLTTILEN
jgi:hypothetical protein